MNPFSSKRQTSHEYPHRRPHLHTPFCFFLDFEDLHLYSYTLSFPNIIFPITDTHIRNLIPRIPSLFTQALPHTSPTPWS